MQFYFALWGSRIERLLRPFLVYNKLPVGDELTGFHQRLGLFQTKFDVKHVVTGYQFHERKRVNALLLRRNIEVVDVALLHNMARLLQ